VTVVDRLIKVFSTKRTIAQQIWRPFLSIQLLLIFQATWTWAVTTNDKQFLCPLNLMRPVGGMDFQERTCLCFRFWACFWVLASLPLLSLFVSRPSRSRHATRPHLHTRLSKLPGNSSNAPLNSTRNKISI
jgi:hypothetical protein